MRLTPPPIGWPLLPRPDAEGGLAFPSLERSIADQIRIILLTRPGEQLMRPTFAAGLENFLHEPNTLTTRRRIRDLISESLTRWEKRLLLDDVAVDDVPQEPGRVRVEISYRLRRTGATRQTGLTIDLAA